MKNIRLVFIFKIFSFFAGFSLLGCEAVLNIPHADPYVEHRFTLANESDYSVQILAYNQSKLLDQIDLPQKKFFVRTVKYGRELKVDNYFNAFSENDAGRRDSVMITFDNKMAILQTCDFSEYYPTCDKTNKKWLGRLIVNEFKEKDNKASKETIYVYYRYEITNEDYARAVPIEQLKK